MRKFVLTSVIAAVAAGLPSMAHAQISAGGSLGYIYDTKPDFELFGAEVRAPLGSVPLTLDPRITFEPLDGGTLVQFDANVLYDLPLKNTTMFLPYVGTGLVLQHFPGTTHVGYNLIGGTKLALHSPWEPFAQFEYSVIINQPNPAEIAVGILYNFGSLMHH